MQRIFDLNQRRFHNGVKMTVDQAVALYKTELMIAERNEQITRSFVDMAFTVWDRALSKTVIQNVVLEEEENHKDSLFNKISKLQVIVSKAHFEEDIEFCFIALHDYHKAGLISTADMSQRKLEGTPKVDNGKGFVDLLRFKKKMRGHLLDEVIAKASLKDAERRAIREVCGSFDEYRRRVPFGSVTTDLGWRAGSSKAADIGFSLVEDTVFTTTHDDTLKGALRQAKACEDTMELGSLAAALKNFNDAIAAIKEKDRELGGDSWAQQAGCAPDSLAVTAGQVLEDSTVVLKFKASMTAMAGGKPLTEETVEQIEAAETVARRLVDSNIKLIDMPSSKKRCKEALLTSAAGKMMGQPNQKFVGIFFDPALFGEPITSPHLRIPSVDQVLTKATPGTASNIHHVRVKTTELERERA